MTRSVTRDVSAVPLRLIARRIVTGRDICDAIAGLQPGGPTRSASHVDDGHPPLVETHREDGGIALRSPRRPIELAIGLRHGPLGETDQSKAT
jgi:hypothetical protein